MFRLVLMPLMLMFFTGAGSADVDTWAVDDGRGTSHISGSSEDFRRIAELKNDLGSPFVYARRGRLMLVITDREVVEAVRSLCEEPADLEARRLELEAAFHVLETEEMRLDRLADLLDEGEDSGHDVDNDRAEQELEQQERRFEKREAELERVERRLDRDYENWEEKLERDVKAIVDHAIDRGLAVTLRR